MNPLRAINQLLNPVNIYFDRTGFHVLRESKAQHPRVLLHNGVSGSDFPLIRNDGTVDDSVLSDISRFSHWCTQPTFMWDQHADVLQELRRLGTKVWAHFLVGRYWPVNSPDRTSYQARYQDIVGNTYFRRPDGTPWENGCADITVEHIRRDLVDLWSEVLRTGLFDGALVDWMCRDNRWRLAPVLDSSGNILRFDNPIAFAAHGFSNEVDWDAAMLSAQCDIWMALRSRFPDLTLVGNGGPAGDYAGGTLANGWWRENFPNQNGGTWDSNVTGPWGLLSDSARYKPWNLLDDRAQFKGPADGPFASVLAVAASSDPNPSPGWSQSRVRLALASCCLGEGIFVLGPSNYDYRIPYRTWRLPEYSIDRSTGLPGNRVDGWLGRATSGAYQVGAGCWAREFVYGMVIANPTIGHQAIGLPFTCVPVGIVPGPELKSVNVYAGDAVFLGRA